MPPRALDDAIYDRQAEPRHLPARFSGKEWLEDFVMIARDIALAQHVSLHLEQFPNVLAHGQRVGMLAADFARWLGLDESTVETVRIARRSRAVKGCEF